MRGTMQCIVQNLSMVLDMERTILVPSKAVRRKHLTFEFRPLSLLWGSCLHDVYPLPLAPGLLLF